MKGSNLKILVLCAYGSNMEIVARALRLKGLSVVSWSGNAKQLENICVYSEKVSNV